MHRFVLATLALTSAARQTDAACRHNNACESCVTDDSFVVASCRWCPKTNSCHEWGSWWNECDDREVVIRFEKGCPGSAAYKIANSIIYDESFAKELFHFAAAAYAIHPEACVAKVAPEDFEVYDQQEVGGLEGNTTTSAFIAVSHSRNAIVIAFRGSITFWQVGVQAFRNLVHLKANFEHTEGSVYLYFFEAFIRLKPFLIETMLELQSLLKHGYEVWVTGHSLGGALGSLAAVTLRAENFVNSSKLKLITFGEPRVGTFNYAKSHDSLVPYSFRVVNRDDVVPHAPPCNFLLGSATSCWASPKNRVPYHHGTEVWYNGIDPRPITCRGNPPNEDEACSNGLSFLKSLNPFSDASLHKRLSFASHRCYFGVQVAAFGNAGCNADGTVVCKEK